MSRDGTMILNLDEIVVPLARRAPSVDTIKRLAESIKQIGLQHPITVRPGPGKLFTLVAGAHRLEAVRSLREEAIRASIMKADEVDARLWEISENLHRAELSVTERADQITEYTRLVNEKREAEKQVQLAPVSAGGRGKEGGERLAARELGITREEIRRAEKISSITPEAKEAAREAGIDNNQSALLRVVAEPSPERQLAAIRREQEVAESHRRNRVQDKAIALTEAQQFSEWLMARIDLQEMPQLISWLEGCKPKEVIAALRREAA